MVNEQCRKCGACCRAGYVLHLTEDDLTREPRLRQHTDGRYYDGTWLLPTGEGCPLLDGNECSIHDTKPWDCQQFVPGDARCRELRAKEGGGDAK